MKRARPAASNGRTASAAGAAKPRRAPGPAARLAAVEAEVAALRERLAALETRLGPPDIAHRGRLTPPAAEPQPLDDAILDAVAALDRSLRYGGLVPIPELRAELQRRGIDASAGGVTEALERLERGWKIDLSVAQSPAQIADRAAGIERPGRGLLYYVARR